MCGISSKPEPHILHDVKRKFKILQTPWFCQKNTRIILLPKQLFYVFQYLFQKNTLHWFDWNCWILRIILVNFPQQTQEINEAILIETLASHNIYLESRFITTFLFQSWENMKDERKQKTVIFVSFTTKRIVTKYTFISAHPSLVFNASNLKRFRGMWRRCLRKGNLGCERVCCWHLNFVFAVAYANLAMMDRIDWCVTKKNWCNLWCEISWNFTRTTTVNSSCANCKYVSHACNPLRYVTVGSTVYV